MFVVGVDLAVATGGEEMMKPMYEVRVSGSQERYLNTYPGDVLIRPLRRPLRTVGGYVVLSPEEAESLRSELHHWLEGVV